MSLKFSLIIPLAPDRNAEILKSIKELDYPKSDFNIIIVKGKNPSENRNIGSEKAQGDIIIFLDDDAIINRDYLKNAEKFFNENPDIDIVGGIQLTPESDRGFAKISGYALSSKFGAWKVSNRYSGKRLILNADESMLTSANLICRKEVMEKIKFDVRFFPGEDPKFVSDAKNSGFKIAYNPELIIYHKRRPTTKGLIKQIFSYGKTRPKKESFSETLFKRPFFLIPSIFVIYIILLIISIIIDPSITRSIININNSIIAENFTEIILFLWFLPLLAYIILIILFAFYDSLKNKNLKAVFVLPVIYPIIHISYGIGIISGYINKLKNK